MVKAERLSSTKNFDGAALSQLRDTFAS